MLSLYMLALCMFFFLASRNKEAIAKKCKEKRPHEARFCELHKVYFSNF